MAEPRVYYAYMVTEPGCSQIFVGSSGSLEYGDWVYKYGVSDLVWYQPFDSLDAANDRADELRALSHKRRMILVKEQNPAVADIGRPIAKKPSMRSV